jgi:hypothetical protein
MLSSSDTLISAGIDGEKSPLDRVTTSAFVPVAFMKVDASSQGVSQPQ